jgi:hypothetical protein
MDVADGAFVWLTRLAAREIHRAVKSGQLFPDPSSYPLVAGKVPLKGKASVDAQIVSPLCDAPTVKQKEKLTRLILSSFERDAIRRLEVEVKRQNTSRFLWSIVNKQKRVETLRALQFRRAKKEASASPSAPAPRTRKRRA